MKKPNWNKDFSPPGSFDEMFFGSSHGVGVLPTKNAGFRTHHPIIDNEACIKCSLCFVYCPEGCIDKSTNEMLVDLDYCKGCGICAKECPKKCIVMEKDGEADE